jgi:hypothetical protein
MTMRTPLFSAALVLGLAAAALAQNPIHVTYLWHMHQPVYFPYESVTDTDNNNRFVYSVRGIHDERSGNYGDWPKNAVQQGADRNMPHAGVQVSFSGSLMENLGGIWGTGWRDHWRHGRNTLRTSLDNPRLDAVGFAYHHSLMPLTCKESMIMQIRLHREAYADNWNTGGGYSKGFFPPESSFAVNMIPALVDQGIEWVLVDNGHFDRTLDDFPWSAASSIRPNRAEQRNGSVADKNSQWTQLNNVWAPTRVAAPWSYQPHYVRHVNPWTGEVKKIIAVPAGRYEGNENGRGGYGAFKPQNVWGEHIAKNNNATKPMIIVAHSDGDNFGMKNADAFHGQHGLFLDMIQSNSDFAHTTVQDYLDMYPPAENDLIHVEPGSWVGIDGGTPYYDKWIENNARDGQHPDYWSWSVIVAAQNRVLHADNLENSYSMNDIRWGIGPDTAKAWRYYLQAETSCHWYWDYDTANPWDGNATRGANLAVAEANKVIARHPGIDRVGPSIFPPQRPIWNPGGKHWTDSDIQPSDFGIWTFVDDASGVANVRLYWRTADWDTWSDLTQTAHELYAHTPGKNSAWNVEPMTGSWYPAAKGPNVPDPAARAQKYDATIAGQNNTLINYFVEAVDTAGNTNRSEIFHVWVGEDTGGGGETGPRVEFDPPAPDGCNPVTIQYRKAGTPLGGAQVYIHVGHDDWQDTILPNPAMTDSGDFWTYVYNTPDETSVINVAFNNGGDVWDNNGGIDYGVAVANCSTGGGGGPVETVWTVPAAPDGCDPVTIFYNPANRPLSTAGDVRIHIGHDGWQDVILPNPAMTREGSYWTYVYAPPAGTEEINFVFNDGGPTWDNNSQLDWNVSVANCTNGPVPPTGLAITNPPSDIIVGNGMATYTLSGIAEGMTGSLTWTNALTGAAGSLPAAATWSLPDLALGIGSNLFIIRGSNVITGGTATNAYDDASDPAYASNWESGSNGGTGFLGWQLNGGDNAGHFIGSKGFGFWSHEGDNLSEAIRQFPMPLTIGKTFTIQFQNGWIWENGGSVGFAIRNSLGDSVWQFYFNGGDTHYSTPAGASPIAWTDAPVQLSFSTLESGMFSATAQAQGGTLHTFGGSYTGDIAGFRVWSHNNGTSDTNNPNRDFFVDFPKITSPSAGGVETHSDFVTITRQAGSSVTEPIIHGMGRMDSAGGGMRFALESSTPGATYALWESPTLFPSQNWQRIHASATQSQGGALQLDWTNLPVGTTNFYRIGVAAP